MEKWRVIRIIIIVVSAFMIVNLSRSIWDLWRRRDILGERQAVLRRVEAEHARLQKELDYAQSPEFIEQEARNRLGLGKEGETVVLLPKSQITNPNDQTNEEKEEIIPNWKRWWRLFF
ncbi:MAG: septum formation initiator family protein [Candidatus Gottesmanbacteria bacterium]|nr:septum formation initiator family protein [Candidatus Gottesmanbacteria bacterium]